MIKRQRAPSLFVTSSKTVVVYLQNCTIELERNCLFEAFFSVVDIYTKRR